jgi:hypothetical protein
MHRLRTCERHDLRSYISEEELMSACGERTIEIFLRLESYESLKMITVFPDGVR